MHVVRLLEEDSPRPTLRSYSADLKYMQIVTKLLLLQLQQLILFSTKSSLNLNTLKYQEMQAKNVDKGELAFVH